MSDNQLELLAILLSLQMLAYPTALLLAWPSVPMGVMITRSWSMRHRRMLAAWLTLIPPLTLLYFVVLAAWALGKYGYSGISYLISCAAGEDQDQTKI